MFGNILEKMEDFADYVHQRYIETHIDPEWLEAFRKANEGLFKAEREYVDFDDEESQQE